MRVGQLFPFIFGYLSMFISVWIAISYFHFFRVCIRACCILLFNGHCEGYYGDWTSIVQCLFVIQIKIWKRFFLMSKFLVHRGGFYPDNGYYENAIHPLSTFPHPEVSRITIVTRYFRVETVESTDYQSHCINYTPVTRVALKVGLMVYGIFFKEYRGLYCQIVKIPKLVRVSDVQR